MSLQRAGLGAFVGQSPRLWRVLASVISVLFGAFVLTGCASNAVSTPLHPVPPTDSGKNHAVENRTSDAAIAARLPSNYRVLMAQYIVTHGEGIHDGFISKPYERYGGLFRGGTDPTICAVVLEDTLFGPRWHLWPLTIINGQVETSEPGTIETFANPNPCNDRLPFPELRALIKH